MDNFIDKLAQKFTATDQIKTGTYSDAKEIAKLKEKIEGYENLLQDMRKLNLKNVESAEKLKELAEASVRTAKQAENSIAKAESSISKAEETIEKAKETVSLADEKVRTAEDNAPQGGADKEYMDTIYEKTADVIHRENVKVYRNVQATVQASLEDQTKSIIEAQTEVSKKNSTTFLKVMSVLIFIAVLADIALKVLTMFHII